MVKGKENANSYFRNKYSHNDPVDAALFFKSFFYIAVVYLRNIIM